MVFDTDPRQQPWAAVQQETIHLVERQTRLSNSRTSRHGAPCPRRQLTPLQEPHPRANKTPAGLPHPDYSRKLHLNKLHSNTESTEISRQHESELGSSFSVKLCVHGICTHYQCIYRLSPPRNFYLMHLLWKQIIASHTIQTLHVYTDNRGHI